MIGICAILIAVFAIFTQRQKNSKNIREKDDLILQLSNLITGGDSYVFIEPTKIIHSNEVQFIINFKGKYPVYDVSIFITEYNLPISEEKSDYFEISKYQLGTFPTINPISFTKTLWNVKLPVEGDDFINFGKKYFLKIYFRNGFIEEEIFIRTINNEFSSAFKVISFEPDYENDHNLSPAKRSKPKVRKIDENFPISEFTHRKGDSSWTANFENSLGLKISEESFHHF
ncbi:hypothetical protein CH361_14445 [Leptospira brenneri]|nr:hypothetical protein CH361_14445 [Leptospira brenneri]